MTGLTLRVACVQLAGQDQPEAAARRVAAAEVLDQCPPVDLLVLPELWPVGFFHFDQYANHAEPLHGLSLAWLAALARDRGCWVHGGSIVERDDDTGELTNTSILMNPAGERQAVYRKAHLFGYQSREAQLLRAGAPKAPSRVGPFSAGLATCYDLRFPEHFRWLLDHGADLFLVASAWPASRLAHWRLLCQARAVENQAWLVACNAAGTDRGVALGGHSLIVDPWGQIVAEGPDGVAVVRADVDFERLQSLRTEFPFLADRRQSPPSPTTAKAPV